MSKNNDNRQVKLNLAPVDFKIAGVLFSPTSVHFEPIYSKNKDQHYLKITIGENQDKVFLVTTRKDGRGVCTLTDFDDFKYTAKKNFLEQKV